MSGRKRAASKRGERAAQPTICIPRVGAFAVSNRSKRSEREAIAAGERRTLTLPSGARASILVKAKGKHVLQASRMAAGIGDQMKFILALIAVRTTIDGSPVTVADLEEMADDDVLTLMAACMGQRTSDQKRRSARTGRRG